MAIEKQVAENQTASLKGNVTEGTQDKSDIKVKSSPQENDKLQVELSSADKSQSQNDTSQETKVQKNLDAEAGKISALERQRNEATAKEATERRAREEAEKRAQELEALRDTADEFFRDDKEAYEKFRGKWNASGKNYLPSYEEVYKTTAPIQGSSQSGASVTELDIDQKVEQKLAERDFTSAVTTFVGKHPEVDVFKKDRNDPDFQKDVDFMKRVSEDAGIAKRRNPNLSWDEAIEKAYNRQDEIIDQVREKAQQTGEVIGMAQRAASNTGTESNISGGMNTSTPEVITLSLEQKANYDRILKNSGKSIANRFARNLKS